jgi:hypothetical protein
MKILFQAHNVDGIVCRHVDYPKCGCTLCSPAQARERARVADLCRRSAAALAALKDQKSGV